MVGLKPYLRFKKRLIIKMDVVSLYGSYVQEIVIPKYQINQKLLKMVAANKYEEIASRELPKLHREANKLSLDLKEAGGDPKKAKKVKKQLRALEVRANKLNEMFAVVSDDELAAAKVNPSRKQVEQIINATVELNQPTKSETPQESVKSQVGKKLVRDSMNNIKNSQQAA
ncbi:MAG: hypothetical protein HYY52_05675 [Candidatus Melainabacteria bacterium]|nr:hypothetical protein [Candidatus Melainabacteria bacterium]